MAPPHRRAPRRLPHSRHHHHALVHPQQQRFSQRPSRGLECFRSHHARRPREKLLLGRRHRHSSRPLRRDGHARCLAKRFQRRLLPHHHHRENPPPDCFSSRMPHPLLHPIRFPKPP